MMSRRSTDTLPQVWLLLTKRKFVDMILDGVKQIEIRWEGTENVDKVKPGDYMLLIARVTDGVLGVAKVIDVVKKPLNAITDEEAQLAGFVSKGEMLQELHKIYQIKSYEEQYYLIRLVPLLDIRHRPIKLRTLGLSLTYWDIRGKLVKVPKDAISKILRALQ